MLRFATWKVVIVYAVAALGILLTIPNFFTDQQIADSPLPIPERKITLGLDLQGGSYLLLEVEVNRVIHDRLEATVDALRAELRKTRTGYVGLGVEGGALVLGLRNPGDFEAVRDAIEEVDSDLSVTRDGDRVRARYGEAKLREIRQGAVAQSIEIIRRRVDETGTREPIIQRQGDDRVLVQLPGVKDPERMKAILGRTARMTFHLVDEGTSVEEARRGQMPPGSMLLPAVEDKDPAGNPILYVVRKRVALSGDRLVDAQPSFQDNQPVVSFRFDTLGARQFGDLTSENVRKRLAIVLDGKVISAPVIQTAILGGSGIITGRFTVQEVNDLALLLRAGALPAPMTILEERTVGPSLGADSIAAGEVAAVIAFILVAVFMVLAYGLLGVFSIISLVINLFLIMACLSLLQATLTLPGIAGIVLTIGMAVDSNVLIYERIREELRAGRTALSAVDTGFNRALATIVDANLTTLIAAVVLYMLGSGPVKGFGVTLSFGIGTTLFTAVMVTRYMVSTWLRVRRPQQLIV